jgi:nucleotide-binding universal stress UspA family protein
MADILACVDESAYASSVCDHAGWFASDPDVGVEVLHVLEDGFAEAAGLVDGAAALATVPSFLVERAVARLREEGVGPVSSAQPVGAFPQVATQRDAKVIVMGKRGRASEAERRRLGSSVDGMIRATTTPVCLTSKVFLPIHRALVLLDADVAHRSALDFVCAQARLADLRLDAVVMCGAGQDAEPKLDLTRSALGAAGGDVFALPANGLDEAVMQYMEARASDLVIVSRTVVAPDPQAHLSRIEERGLWGTRTPVLVC